MIIKTLLLLIVTMLLPIVPSSLNASSASVREYSDTDSLLAETAKELMHAYDFLEMLKRRSEEVAQTSVVPEFDSSLPHNLDQIRQPVRKKLINVLSATRFSSAEKHLVDCREAISALEHYLQTLETITAEQRNYRKRAPLSYVPQSQSKKSISRKKTQPATEQQTTAPTSITDGFNELAAAYDLNNETPAPIPAVTPAPTSAPITPMAQVIEPIKPSTPIEPVSTPAAPALSTQPIAPFEPPVANTEPIKPVEPIKPIAPVIEPIKSIIPAMQPAMPVPPITPTTNTNIMEPTPSIGAALPIAAPLTPAPSPFVMPVPMPATPAIQPMDPLMPIPVKSLSPIAPVMQGKAAPIPVPIIIPAKK